MRILWLKTELLHPVDKDGRIRTYQMLRHLSRRHEVTYLTLANPQDSDEEARQAGEYCARLIRIPWFETRKFSVRFYRELMTNLSSSLPYAIEKYRSRQMREEIGRELRSNRHDLVVCDFLAPSINLPHVVAQPTLLCQHNIESSIWKRHFQQQSGIKRAFFYSQWK